MSRRSDLIEQRRKSFEESLLKAFALFEVTKSVFETPDGRKLTYVRWANPKSGVYSMTFLVRTGTLFVSGDLYASTYRWSEDVSFEWIADCNFGYFFEKLCAAPHERGKIWEQELVLCTVQDELEDHFKQEGVTDPLEIKKLIKDELDKDDLLDEIQRHAGSNHEWSEYVHNELEHPILQPQDGDSRLYGAGEMADYIHYGHLLGVKAATKAIQAKEAAEAERAKLTSQ